LLAVIVGLSLTIFGPASAFGASPTPSATGDVLASYSYDTASNTRESTVAAAFGDARARRFAATSSVVSTGEVSAFPVDFVAADTADGAASIGFRSDATHIFRDAAGHFAEDTPANRAIIRGAVDPANLRSTITLKDGATLSKYFQTLPDGTQAWAEVRNGTEITNGGLNVIPR
jgi:hypothetical protein